MKRLRFRLAFTFSNCLYYTIREKFNIALDKMQANNINALIHSTLHNLKAQKNDAPLNQAAPPIDAAGEIKKFKELFDDGIITKEEFDAKKKQLLNL